MDTSDGNYNSDLPYRPNACILLFNGQNQLFLGERLNSPGEWQFPQGGIEDLEHPEVCALREIHEETGIPYPKLQLVKQLNHSHSYDFPLPPPTYAKGRWKGQTQSFFLVRFLGNNNDINLLAAGEHQEFQSYLWCTPDEVRRNGSPIRLGGYEMALREFEAFIGPITRETGS